MNICLSIPYLSNPTIFQTTKLNQIRKSSEKIMVVDSWRSGNFPGWGSWVVYPQPRPPRPYHDMVAWPRHGGTTCNTLWVDGHATSVRATNPRDYATIYDQGALTSLRGAPDYWGIR
jgi:prepilin-type processing-associated H-X9-DG protein